MCMRVPSSFQDHFASLSDPPSFHAPHLRQDWIDLLVIAVCAVICGAQGWEDIADDGQAQADGFAEVLDVPHGIPRDDAFRRVLSRLAPEELTQCFGSWTAALSDLSGGDIVAIDGKTLRQAFDPATSPLAIHMVRAWASANRWVLGQVKGDDKSNDLTAIPKLLKMLDRSGATVTMDAIGCQKAMAQVITEPGADDVLALKKHHRTRYEEGKRFLDDARDRETASPVALKPGSIGLLLILTGSVRKPHGSICKVLDGSRHIAKSVRGWRWKGGMLSSLCPLMGYGSAMPCGCIGAWRRGCMGCLT